MPPELADGDFSVEATRDDACAAAVCVAGLRKRYGGVEAVSGVSFEVAGGEIFGLLGPNGAGKTTTLECILGLREPDGGSIRIHGLVGAQLQGAALQDKITPREALELFGSFYANPFEAGELLARFDLEDKADAKFASLSGGQRQRLFLALAMVNRPMVLILDEPTAGLDPQARHNLRAVIRELRADGRTVLLSTHDLDEAGQLCGRIAILDAGRIVACAAPAELIAGARAPARVFVRTAPPLAEAVVEALAGIGGRACEGSGWILETREPNRLMVELVRRADEAGAELLDIQVHRPSLEDVFLEVTGRPWPGEGGPGEAA